MAELTILEGFKKALFDAFVWTQAAENQVRRLTPDLDDKCSFYWRIEALKSRICEDLHRRLHELRERRNAVVHDSDYVDRILAGGIDGSYLPTDEEIQCLEEVTRSAGQLYADLLLGDEGLAPAADCPSLPPATSDGRTTETGRRS